MDSAHTPMLRRATGVFVISGYLAMAAVAQVGPLILLVPLLALSFWRFGERLDARYPLYGTLSRALTIAYFCFLPLSWIELGLLPTVVTVVIYIQCYTLVHVKGVRNYYHLFLMSLFLLLAACVQSPEPIIGVVLIIFLVSAIWANMALRIVVEEIGPSRHTEPEIVSIDNLAHHAYRDAPGDHGASIPGVAAALSLVAVAITTVWFLLTPRIEAGVLGRSDSDTQVVGVSDTVDLSGAGIISDDQTPVMLVQFPEEPEGKIENADWLYWRITTHNVYADNQWDDTPTAPLEPGIRGMSNGQRGEDGDVRRVERHMRPDTRVVHQSIYMDEVPRKGVPVLDLVQRVRVDERTKGVELAWSRGNDFTVRTLRIGNRRLSYEAWSEVGEPSPEVLRQVPMDFSQLSEMDLVTLTGSPLNDQSRQLAASLMNGQETLYDKVAAVDAFLSGPDFLYSLDNQATTSGSVIDDFINLSRRGHCEKFATAMALMVRSGGIPARVVSGFRGGEWNDSDRSYTIRANMAHLWVEVWFPTIGWVLFDPSPRADDMPASRLSQLGMLASRAVLKTKIFWFREVVGFDRAAQIERLQDFSLGLIQGLRGRDERETSTARSALGALGYYTPLFVLLFVAGLSGFAAIRVRWIPVPRNFPLSALQIRVVRLYLLLRRHLQRHGLVCAGMTAEELRAELRSERWGAPAEALQVLELYNAVRFGSQTPDGADFPRLRKGILAIRPVETD